MQAGGALVPGPALLAGRTTIRSAVDQQHRFLWRPTSSPGTQTASKATATSSFTTLTTTGSGDVDVTSDNSNIIGGAISAAGGSTLQGAGDHNEQRRHLRLDRHGERRRHRHDGGRRHRLDRPAAGRHHGRPAEIERRSTITVSLSDRHQRRHPEDHRRQRRRDVHDPDPRPGTGDVDVTADTGSVIGGTILAAGGSGTLKATASGQSISGTAVTADAGLIGMTAGGAIGWTGALKAGTTVGLTSTGGTITVNTVGSGGTQTIEAKNDVDFTALKATGILGDAGDIDLHEPEVRAPSSRPAPPSWRPASSIGTS